MLIYFKYILSLISSKNKGFTLTELIVVIAIATVIMTSLIIQQSQWNDQLVVNNQTYEMVLTIRQAKVYSLGVREDLGGSGDKFNIGYGVYLNKNNVNQYIFFADRNGNKRYNIGEAIKTKVFTRGVKINNVCGNTRCFFSRGGPLDQVSISFFRPETKPNINISLLNRGNRPVDTPPITIILKSPKGKTSSIKIEANGQISVSQ